MDTTQELGGRYRLLERIGAGGMSVVWRGEDTVLGRSVAVKVLGPAFATDASSRGRIRDEARAAARLAHPNVAAVYDYGEVPADDGRPQPYLVMELVRGESLAQRLAAGPLPWPRAVTVAAQVAGALVAAHEVGVVHRDVTPANVLLSPTGVKVVDFGIAAPVGGREATTLIGTPAYLAPERQEGRPVTPATDVYALGVLLYQSLSGRLPWPGDTATGVLRAHRHTPPAPLPPVPGLPREVADLCRDCLAKDPAARPDAAHLARRLAAVAASVTVDLPVVPPPAPPGSNPAGAGAAAGAGATPGAAGAGAAAAGLSATRALPTPDAGYLAGVAQVRPRPAAGRPAPIRNPPAAPVPTARRARWLPVLALLALLALLPCLYFITGERSGTGAASGSGSGSAAATTADTAAPAARAVACAVDVSMPGGRGRGPATITVTNTGPGDLSGWTLTFKASERVSGAPGDWSQDGDRVTVASTDALAAGQSATLEAVSNRPGRKLKLEKFALDGVDCGGGQGNGDNQNND